MDVFSCCSRYAECSEKRICLYAADPDYAGCGYRKNLEAGRIFYGINAGKAVADEFPKVLDKLPGSKEIQKDTSIFLHCFNRLFAVRSIDKDLSRNLSCEQADKIETAFAESNIPYKLQIDSLANCVIDYPTEEDPAPANSKVVFEVDNEEFHLLNYNTWLIKKRIAEAIVKAFDNHFIKARVELRGQYANIDRAAVYNAKRVFKVEVIDKRQTPNKDGKPNVQASMFDSPQVIPESTPNIILKLPVKTKEIEPVPVLISTEAIVIAKDMYWGTYRGQLVGAYNRVLTDIKMAQVRIIEMLEPPKQHAILEKRAKFPRDPYPANSVQVFYMDNCEEEAGAHESLCATG